MQNRTYLLILLAIASAVFTWSAIAPHDRFTWILEVLPAVIGATALAATWQPFPLSRLVYGLITLHAIILMIGGHYTYAEVPLFNWIRDEFGMARNHYDRVGHFAQGFVPAMIAREILLRRSPLQRGKWLNFVIVSICLAISAVYELFEWAAAAFSGEAADAFLGTQGDPWDTQKDMTLALIGACTALLLLSRLHDRSMAKVPRIRALTDPVEA